MKFKISIWLSGGTGGGEGGPDPALACATHFLVKAAVVPCASRLLADWDKDANLEISIFLNLVNLHYITFLQ